MLMEPTHLAAFEHQALPVTARGGVGLTVDEADLLQQIGELRPGFCSRGYDTVRLAQYCGVVTLGQRSLEVLPKVDRLDDASASRTLLLRLLSEVADAPEFRHLPTGQVVQDGPLIEVFIAAFFDAVTAVVRGALLRQYRLHEDDLTTVRGRIVLDRQLSALGDRRDRIACRYDELTADNIWNQITKATVAAVRPWIRSNQLNRRWIELMGALDEVAAVDLWSQDLDRLVFSRQAVRYRAVVAWCRWIQALQSPGLRGGSHAAPGLLFDMNALFQSAVTASFRRRFERGSIRVHAEETGTWLARVAGAGDGRMIPLRPDIVVRNGRDVLAIADAKWKILGVSNSRLLVPPESDVYQAHAYAGAFGCERIALVYPWHVGLAPSRETILELPLANGIRPRLSVVCVDLNDEALAVKRGGEWTRG